MVFSSISIFGLIIYACGIVNGAIYVQLKQTEGNTIRTIVTNAGSTDIQLLKDPNSILMPELPTNKFQIAISDDRYVTFDGVAVKWLPEVAAREAEYVAILPGESVHFDHDLSEAYVLHGSEAIPFTVTLNHASFISDTLESLDFDPPKPLLFTYQGTRRSKRETYSAKFVRRVSFVGCSADQQSQIEGAVNAAQTLATSASVYLRAITSGQRYITWFGSYEKNRQATVASNFQNMANGRISIDRYDCTCTQKGVSAYVYPSQLGQIFLCPAFWDAPIVGTDSKAGTIIHESSHFLGSKEIAFNQENSKTLAINNPSNAYLNADSYQYFAENTPLTV